MKALELPSRLLALSPWLAARRPTGAHAAPDWPQLAAWLTTTPQLGAAVAEGHGRRLGELAAWADTLDGWRVFLVPVAPAFGTALERDYLVCLHEVLGRATGEQSAPAAHPNGLRDVVAEQLELGEITGSAPVLLVVDGLEAALDGEPRHFIDALQRRAPSPGQPALKLLLTGGDAAKLAQLAGVIPTRLGEGAAPTPTSESDAPTFAVLAAVHGPVERDTIPLDPARLSRAAAHPAVVDDGARIAALADDLSIDPRAIAEAQRQLTSLARSQLARWRTSGQGPSAYFVRHMRSHLVEAWREGGSAEARDADGGEAISLASADWSRRWSHEPNGLEGFLGDVCAIRRTVASVRAVHEEVRCALVEASAHGEARAATPRAPSSPEARTLVSLAAHASPPARETLLSWADAELTSSADAVALTELARATSGERRRRAARAALRLPAPATSSEIDLAERAFELASLAGEDAVPEALRVWDALAPELRGAALDRVPLSPDLARVLWDRLRQEGVTPIDAHALVARALGSSARQHELAALAEKWLEAVEHGIVGDAIDRAGRVLVPSLGGGQLDRLQVELQPPRAVACALVEVVAVRLAALGRRDDAGAWIASSNEACRTSAELALIAAQPSSERAAAADRHLARALTRPLNLAIATAAALLPYASGTAAQGAVRALVKRFLEAPDSHTELGFGLPTCDLAPAGDGARAVFSRLLDWLVDGSPRMSRRRLLCGQTWDLRSLAPLIRAIGGDQALIDVGGSVIEVARQFPRTASAPSGPTPVHNGPT